MNAIDIDGLGYAYKAHWALQKVSFSVADRAIHGFVGPNGAGKTTTLKILATLMRPTRGRVRVFDQEIQAAAQAVRPLVGYMPDHFSMYKSMTVQEYLDFFAAAYGLPVTKRKRVIDDVLALTDMDGRRKSFIRGLSRGMQQRVCLARVLVHDPKLLLLDEPASGLDPRARIELMEILRELRNMGKTVFISSHILSELADLCESVTILDRGTVKYTGPMGGLLSTVAEHEVAWRVEVDLVAGELIAALQALPGISQVQAEDNAPVLRLRGDADQVGSEAVLRCLLEQGSEVRRFGRDERRLDQAFMELTTAGVRT